MTVRSATFITLFSLLAGPGWIMAQGIGLNDPDGYDREKRAEELRLKTAAQQQAMKQKAYDCPKDVLNNKDLTGMISVDADMRTDIVGKSLRLKCSYSGGEYNEDEAFSLSKMRSSWVYPKLFVDLVGELEHLVPEIKDNPNFKKIWSNLDSIVIEPLEVDKDADPKTLKYVVLSKDPNGALSLHRRAFHIITHYAVGFPSQSTGYFKEAEDLLSGDWEPIFVEQLRAIMTTDPSPPQPIAQSDQPTRIMKVEVK